MAAEATDHLFPDLDLSCGCEITNDLIATIKACKNPNAFIGRDREHLLHAFARIGHHFVVDSLLKDGADPSAVDDNGMTPLMTAALFGNDGIVRLLIHGGSDVYAQDCRGETALLKAARKGNAVIVSMLLSYRADDSTPNHEGRTALDEAARLSRDRGLAVVKTIVELHQDKDELRVDAYERAMERARAQCNDDVVAYLNPVVEQCYADLVAKIGGVGWGRWVISKLSGSDPADVESPLPQRPSQRQFKRGIPGTANATHQTREGASTYQFNHYLAKDVAAGTSSPNCNQSNGWTNVQINYPTPRNCNYGSRSHPASADYCEAGANSDLTNGYVNSSRVIDVYTPAGAIEGLFSGTSPGHTRVDELADPCLVRQISCEAFDRDGMVAAIEAAAAADHPNVMPLAGVAIVDSSVLLLYSLGRGPITNQLQHRPLNSRLEWARDFVRGVLWSQSHCGGNLAGGVASITSDYGFVGSSGRCQIIPAFGQYGGHVVLNTAGDAEWVSYAGADVHAGDDATNSMNVRDIGVVVAELVYGVSGVIAGAQDRRAKIVGEQSDWKLAKSSTVTSGDTEGPWAAKANAVLAVARECLDVAAKRPSLRQVLAKLASVLESSTKNSGRFDSAERCSVCLDHVDVSAGSTAPDCALCQRRTCGPCTNECAALALTTFIAGADDHDELVTWESLCGCPVHRCDGGLHTWRVLRSLSKENLAAAFSVCAYPSNNNAGADAAASPAFQDAVRAIGAAAALKCPECKAPYVGYTGLATVSCRSCSKLFCSVCDDMTTTDSDHAERVHGTAFAALDELWIRQRDVAVAEVRAVCEQFVGIVDEKQLARVLKQLGHSLHERPAAEADTSGVVESESAAAGVADGVQEHAECTATFEAVAEALGGTPRGGSGDGDVHTPVPLTASEMCRVVLAFQQLDSQKRVVVGKKLLQEGWLSSEALDVAMGVAGDFDKCVARLTNPGGATVAATTCVDPATEREWESDDAGPEDDVDASDSLPPTEEEGAEEATTTTTITTNNNSKGKAPSKSTGRSSRSSCTSKRSNQPTRRSARLAKLNDEAEANITAAPRRSSKGKKKKKKGKSAAVDESAESKEGKPGRLAKLRDKVGSKFGKKGKTSKDKASIAADTDTVTDNNANNASASHAYCHNESDGDIEREFVPPNAVVEVEGIDPYAESYSDDEYNEYGSGGESGSEVEWGHSDGSPASSEADAEAEVEGGSSGSESHSHTDSDADSDSSESLHANPGPASTTTTTGNGERGADDQAEACTVAGLLDAGELHCDCGAVLKDPEVAAAKRDHYLCLSCMTKYCLACFATSANCTCGPNVTSTAKWKQFYVPQILKPHRVGLLVDYLMRFDPYEVSVTLASAKESLSHRLYVPHESLCAAYCTRLAEEAGRGR